MFGPLVAFEFVSGFRRKVETQRDFNANPFVKTSDATELTCSLENEV